MPRSPITWPGGAHVALIPAVCLETWPEDELGRPGSAQASFRRDVPSGSLFTVDVAAITDRLYGERAGAQRVLDAFDDFGVKTSWFLNGAGVEAFPDLAREILAAGHELGSENWRHQYIWRQTDAEQKADLERTIAAFERNLGVRPKGFITPGERMNDYTMPLLAELGYTYYMGFLDEDLPYTLRTAKGDLTVMHYGIWLNDHMLAYGIRKDPRDLYQWCRDEFDQLYEEGAKGRPGLIVIGIHPFSGGRPFRAKALREFLGYATAKPKVWFPRCIDAAEHYRTHFGDRYVLTWPLYGTGLPRPKEVPS